MFRLAPLPVLACIAALAGCRSAAPDTDPVADNSPARRIEVEAYLESHYKSVPLLVSRDRTRYYIPVEVNGKPGRLLLDSGAVASVLFESSLPKFGMTGGGFTNRAYSGVGGDVTSGRTRFDSMILAGSITVQPGSFPIVRNDSIPDADGLLGNDILRNLRAAVDFRHRRLWFLDAETRVEPGLDAAANTAGLKTAVLRDLFGQAFLDVRIAGRTYQCIVDTGAPEWLLTESAADELGLEKTGLPVRARGVGEETVDQYAVVLPRRAVIGKTFMLERCRVLVAEHGGDIPIYNYGGLFGAAPLADNDAILDIGNRRLYFDRQRLRSRHAVAETPEAAKTLTAR